MNKHNSYLFEYHFEEHTVIKSTSWSLCDGHLLLCCGHPDLPHFLTAVNCPIYMKLFNLPSKFPKKLETLANLCCTSEGDDVKHLNGLGPWYSATNALTPFFFIFTDRMKGYNDDIETPQVMNPALNFAGDKHLNPKKSYY